MPDVVSATDYSSFGVSLLGRQINASNVEYGFNGKWNEIETGYQNYGMRDYDARARRFTSVDPLTRKYPWYTPYQFAGNKPIKYIDVDGLEEGEAGEVDEEAELDRELNSSLKTESEEEERENFRRSQEAKGKLPRFSQNFRELLRTFNNHVRNGIEISPSVFGEGETKTYTDDPRWDVFQLFNRNSESQSSSELKKTNSEETSTKAQVNENKTYTQSPIVSDKRTRRQEYAQKTFIEAGKNASDVNKLMGTIDFSRAVKETILNPGDAIWRFERTNSKNGEAHFFTDAYGADAGPTGVGFGDASGYKLVKYEVLERTSVMESTIRGTKNKQYFSTQLQNKIKKVAEE